MLLWHFLLVYSTLVAKFCDIFSYIFTYVHTYTYTYISMHTHLHVGLMAKRRSHFIIA